MRDRLPTRPGSRLPRSRRRKRQGAAMPTPEERLRELGIELPQPAAPVASYVPCVRTGNLIYVSGQVPLVDGRPAWTGRLGAGGPGVDEGAPPARGCAVNPLAALKAA